MRLALRMGDSAAATAAVRFIEEVSRPVAERVAIIRALGETRTARSVESLVHLLRRPEPESIHTTALSALGYFRPSWHAGQPLETYDHAV